MYLGGRNMLDGALFVVFEEFFSPCDFSSLNFLMAVPKVVLLSLSHDVPLD